MSSEQAGLIRCATGPRKTAEVSLARTTQSISDRVTELFGGTCDVTDRRRHNGQRIRGPLHLVRRQPAPGDGHTTPAEGSSVKESDIRAALQSVLPAHVELVVTVVTTETPSSIAPTLRHKDHLDSLLSRLRGLLEFAGVLRDSPGTRLATDDNDSSVSQNHCRTTTSPNPGIRLSPYPDRLSSISRNRLPVLVRTTSTMTPMAKARMAKALTMTPADESRQARFVVVTRPVVEVVGATDNQGT